MFGKNKFTAMLALAGLTAATTTPELVTAANDELETAGITGASLITEAAYNDLTAKAGRVDAAEASAKDATAAQATAEASAKGFTDALAAAGAKDIADLVAQRDGFKASAEQLGKQGDAEHTTPNLAAGKTDVEKGEPDAHQKAIDELPHNKALSGHPIFG